MTLTIITGASRGIGRAIAEDLKGYGHEFILLSSYVVDFENPHAVNDKVSMLIENVDADSVNVILCAAKIGTAYEMDLLEFESLYRINVLSNLAVIKAASNLNVPMRIVWFAGGGAAFPYPEFFGYSLTKVAVVRAVENLSTLLGDGSSIIALAPGAVQTDMLQKVLDAGCEVRTRTDISEPVNFVRKFITDEFDSLALNGMFLHVRDDLSMIDQYTRDGVNLFKLRRIE